MTRRHAPLVPLTLALLLGSGAAAPAGAQTLKLATLRLFPSDVVGPWVTYKVRSQSGRSPIREMTQRVAIVARERYRGERAYWVELKTTDRVGSRIERGLFAGADPESMDVVEEGLEPPFLVAVDSPGAVRPLRLVRYQVLSPGGKLYEYPVNSATSTRSRGEVSSFELFEFDPTARPVRTFLGPDTLTLGRRVVPSVLERVWRAGSEDWPTTEDSAATYRLILTQMIWRNAAVPITGYARSLLRVTTRRTLAASDSMGRPIVPVDSTSFTFSPVDTTVGPTRLTAGDGHLLSWTELTLVDLGADAVAEVTQKPEPAPVAERPTAPRLIR